MIKFTGKVNIIPSKKKEEQVIKQAPMTKNQAQNKIMNDLALYNNATKKKSVVEKLNQQKKQQTPNFGGTVLEKKGAINDMKEGVPYKVNNNTISKDSSGVTHGGAGRSMDYTFNNKDYENLYNTSKTIKNEDLGTMALELDRISTLPAQDIYKMIGDSQEKLLKQNDIFYGKKMSKDEESKLKLKLDNLNKIYKEKTNKTYGQQQLQNGADTITYSVGNAGNQAVKGFWNGVEYVGELVDKASQRRMNVANKYFESKGEAPKYSQEEINNGNILTRFSDKVINASNNIDESLANKTQNLNNISKKAIEISGAIGNMGTGIATNMILPGTGAGMLAFTTSAAGGYRREGLSRGMTEDQALAYGTINGLLEGATEQISFGTLSKGVKALGVGRYTKALGLQLLGMGENALQEALMEPANEVTALMLNGKNVWQDNEGNITEKSIKDGFKELGSRMIQSGIDGAIVSLVMGGVGSGFQTSINVAQKVLNGEQISQQDIQAMEEELSNAGVDTNNISNQYNQKITEISQQGNQQLALKDVVQQTNDIMPPKTDLNNEGNIITIPKNEANIQTLPSGQENVKMFPQKDNFSVNNNGSNKVKILKNGVEGEFEIRSYNPETKEYFGEVTLDNNTRGFTTIKQEDIVSDIDKNAKTWYNNNEGGDSNERYKGNEQGRNNSGSITNSLQQGGLVGENNKGNGLYNQQGQRGRGSLPGSTNVSRGTNSSSFSNDNDGNSQLTHYKENIVRPDEQIAKKQYVDTIKNEYAKKKISTAKLYNDMTPNDVKTIESIYDGKILNYDELQNANIIKTAENYNETTKDKYEYLKDDTEPTPQQLNNFNKINQEFLKEASTKAKERKAQIIVGLPSSGKSSAVATDLLNKNNAFELDNDIIKALMTNKYLEYDVYDNGKGANNCQNASSYISDDLALPQLLKDGTNVVIPIVGKSEKSIHNKLDKLLEAGYKIELYNVRLPKEKALNRATTRFAESGRYVSLNYINHIDTNAIDNAFNAVKDTPGILYWEIINNDVPFGTKAKIIESSKNSKKSSFSLPTKEQLQEFENKKTKKIGGSLVDIANMTKKDAELPKINYVGEKDKGTANVRKFYENVETSNMIAQEVKDRIEPTSYEVQENEQTMANAKKMLEKDRAKVVNEWQTKDIKKFTGEDVALGAILLEQYQQDGDFESAVNVIEKLANAGTQAGRTVQMYSIFQRLTPEAMQIYQARKLDSVFEKMKETKTGEWVEKNKDKFKLTPEDAQFIQAKITEAQQSPTERAKQIALGEIETRINEKLPPEAGQSIKAFRRIAMLFNPKTQIRNIMGNATVLPLNYVADLVATQLDKAIAKKTGTRTTDTMKAKTMGKGFVKGTKETIEDYKLDIRTSPTGAKYEIEGNAKAFNEHTKLKVEKAINRKLNAINKMLNTILEAGDRPFYEATYQNSLNNQMKANNVATPTIEMIDIAVNEALERTWQDSNELTKAVLSIRSALNSIGHYVVPINGIGLGDLIIPFAKTPANLTKAMIDYSPLASIRTAIEYTDMKKAISRGEFTPAQQKKFVSSMGKMISGTIFSMIAYALAKSGAITGSGDDDKDVANFEKNILGIQPYSIKIGNKSYTYNWAQPLANPLGIMADINKMTKEGATLSEMLINGFKVAGDQLVANSFLQGIQELFASDSISEGIADAVLGIGGQFTPTIFGQVASMFDDTKRQTYEKDGMIKTSINEVKNKIPGAKNTLAPQVNTLGEEVKNYGGDNNLFNIFLNPGNISKSTASETAKEIYDLYNLTRDKTIFPRQAPYSISYQANKTDKEKTKKILSSQERAEYLKASGEYTNNQLADLFQTDYYKKLDGEDKVEIINKILDDAQTTAKDIFIDNKTTEEFKKLKDELGNVSMVDYYTTWQAQKNAEGKKNFKGETISGSVKKAKIKAINDAIPDLTKKDRKALYGIFDLN